jgi:hypothetical protein
MMETMLLSIAVIILSVLEFKHMQEIKKDLTPYGLVGAALNQYTPGTMNTDGSDRGAADFTKLGGSDANLEKRLRHDALKSII